MNKNITIVLLFTLLVCSNAAWILLKGASEESTNQGTQAELEIRQRDVVITEMSSLINHQYSDKTKSEIANQLKKAFGEGFVSEDNQYIFYGSTVKLEFKDGKLVRVYW